MFAPERGAELALLAREPLKARWIIAPHDYSSKPRLRRRKWATGRATARRFVGQARVDKETPSFAAITLVAPGVRFNAFAILVTPDFAFAIVFIVRTSSFVHARRTTFLAFAILSPNRTGIEPTASYHDCLNWRSMNKLPLRECERDNATQTSDM